LSNETKLLREQHRTTTGSRQRRFQILKSGANHCLFVSTTIASPNELIENIFKHVKESKQTRTRYIERLLPVVNVCKAYDDDIEKFVEQKEFYEQIRSIIVADDSLDTSTKTIVKYDVVAKKSNNNHMKSSKIEELIIKHLNEKYPDTLKRDYKQPDVHILVHVIRTFCLFSIVKNYNEYKKYNLSTVNMLAIGIKSPIPTITDDEKPTITDDGKPTIKEEQKSTINNTEKQLEYNNKIVFNDSDHDEDEDEDEDQTAVD